MPNITSSAIYARLLESCARYRLQQEPWSRFPPDREAFCAPQDGAAALSSLRAEFGDDAVVGSGIASAATDGTLQLAAGLEPGGLIVALRPQPKHAPFDLLTATGCLSGTVPITAVLGDFWTQQVLRVAPIDRELLVAFTIADVVALRSLGLAATLASPPQRYRGPVLRSFAGDRSAIVLLVGWSPSRMETVVPAGFRNLCAHIANFEEHVDSEIGGWQAWQPPADAVEAYSYMLEYAERDLVRQAFIESHGRFDLRAAADGSVDPDARHDDPDTLIAAWTKLRKSRSAGSDQSSQAERWRQYEETFERDVIGPALQAALAEDDVQRRGLLLVLAELSRLRHPLAARLTEMALELQSAPAEAWGRFPFGQVKDFLAIVDRFLAVARQLDRGGHPRRFAARRRPR